MTSLYQLRSSTTEGYQILKLDPPGSYFLTADACTCPQGHKATCRHRKMLPLFVNNHHVDDGWFLDWDTRLWRAPIGVEYDSNGHETASLADETTLPMERPAARGEEPASPSPAPTVEPPAPVPVGATKPLKRRKLS